MFQLDDSKSLFRKLLFHRTSIYFLVVWGSRRMCLFLLFSLWFLLSKMSDNFFPKAREMSDQQGDGGLSKRQAPGLALERPKQLSMSCTANMCKQKHSLLVLGGVHLENWGNKWSNLTCAYFSNGLVQPPIRVGIVGSFLILSLRIRPNLSREEWYESRDPILGISQNSPGFLGYKQLRYECLLGYISLDNYHGPPQTYICLRSLW